MNRRLSLSLASCAFVTTAGIGAAAAQPTPKFEFGKAADVKDVKDTEWSATAEAGLVFTTGNARTTTITGGAKLARKEKKNKFSLDAAGTLAKSQVLIANDINGDGVLTSTEVTRNPTTAAEAYNVKLRYDRFLTEFNSLFVAALAGADVVAGKDFVGGGQIGYSRLLYKDAKHEMTGEFGYDFSYENYASADTASVSIHSARAFVGYKGKLSETTSVDGSVEALANVNRLSDEIGPLKDTRVNAGVSLSTKLTKSMSFSFGVVSKFDNTPAPVSIAGFTLDTINPPTNLKLDTTTKASLIINFL